MFNDRKKPLSLSHNIFLIMETIDWGSLGFGYVKTDYNVRSYFRDGKWGDLEVHTEETITLPMAATCLHYGQEAFEGLKAFRGKDGKIRLFRPEENAKRMKATADYVCMQCPDEDFYLAAVKKVVELNAKYVPPYGTGASLYIRPLLIGTGAQVGVHPSSEYLFMIFVTPVGPYYKDGFKPIDVIVDRLHDRAAPRGTGHIKVGGNYAASMESSAWGHDHGYNIVLYLDAKEKKYIDECGAANFFAVRDNTYITPNSHSILPSITNKSLQVIAADLGMKVEARPVAFDEMVTFEEAGACGTAAVITPINKIVDIDHETVYTIAKNGQPGPNTVRLYQQLVGIQNGDLPDTHGWNLIIE
jgi:branched-chain amino acid aminotransferase